MKQGSAVHRALEDEVHVTVPVKTVLTKEDSWGLRIWNVIQGLRTLRETGRTRELEIWGSLGGELVNGIIDELSCECPDPKLEEHNLKLMSKRGAEPPLPEYQFSIRDYLVSNGRQEKNQSTSEALVDADEPKIVQRPSRSENERRIYITDVKTRGGSSVPTGSSIRPTLVQLHLYHHMLENLAQGRFKLSDLAMRYAFDIHKTFSDEFIVEIGGLNQGPFYLTEFQPKEQEGSLAHGEVGERLLPPTQPSSTQDSMDLLLQHNNIETLWDLMMDQYRQTFILPTSSNSTSNSNSQDFPSSTPQSLSQIPDSPAIPTRLSPLLTAQYISTSRKSASKSKAAVEAEADTHTVSRKIIGSRSIIFNSSFLTNYLHDALAFWRGERDPRGVEIEDAWKCRVCEFRDECAWVRERNELAVREVEERRRVRDLAQEGGGEGKRSRV